MSETIRLRHSAMQHTDGIRATRGDVDSAIPLLTTGPAPDVIGFTELVGDTKRLVAARCAEAGYRLHVAKSVGLAVHPRHTVLGVQATDVLPTFRSPSGRGSYRARPILEVTLRTPDGNEATVHESHWITDGGERREGKRGRQSEAMVDRVRGNARGSRIGLWMGDTNEDEGRRPEGEVQKPLTRGGLVSIYDALDTYPDTHGRKTIDVIGHYDGDRRVTPLRVKVGPQRHSDHRVVDAAYRIDRVDDTQPPRVVEDPSMTITQRVVRDARRRGVTVLTHDQWGSQHQAVYTYRREHKPVPSPVDTLVQHITVTFDSGVLVGDFATDMQTVERIGMERFGSGVSYNFVVDMATGMVGVGQPLDASGTHTVNNKAVPGFSYDQNHWARAIAVLGVPSTRLSDRAELAISHLIAAMVNQGALFHGFDYCPHSMFAFKDCPCDATRDRMPAIQARALATI